MPSVDDLPGDLARLARIIEEIAPGCGVKAVLRVAVEYRGTPLYIRSLDELSRKVRNAWIIRRYESGERVNDIARDPAVGLSARQVWNVLGKEPVDDRQLKLF